MAKAYRAYSDENGLGNEIYGADTDNATLGFAQLDGVLDGVLDDTALTTCDLIFIALYPSAAIDYLERISPMINKNATVIDLCGIKSGICRAGFALAQEYGYTFVGGHPMAGTHRSGYKYSRANMFHGAPMVIVPPRFDDIRLFERIKELLLAAGFGKISFTTAENHDRMIAFTSQLAHVVSNAYVKSPTAREHRGFSAGSYKDMTRVAWLNENMWTELFFENREPLLFELDAIISSLSEYRDALANGDRDRMVGILRDGRLAKEEIDG